MANLGVIAKQWTNSPWLPLIAFSRWHQNKSEGRSLIAFSWCVLYEFSGYFQQRTGDLSSACRPHAGTLVMDVQPACYGMLLQLYSNLLRSQGKAHRWQTAVIEFLQTSLCFMVWTGQGMQLNHRANKNHHYPSTLHQVGPV